MRIAFYSDIHGNLAALESVLANIRAQRVERVYCLGDLVGYAPFPNEVVERVRSDHTPTVMVNYDDGVGFDRDECGCAYREPDEQRLGDMSLQWTRRTVTAENKAYLQTLHHEIRFEADATRFLLVHGSPRRMNEYLFEDRPDSSFERLAKSSQADVILFGHTHKPYLKVIANVHFVNIGSVGKPKDGDPRACYVVLDTQGLAVEFVRVSYDVQNTAAAIRASELPDKFARDIETGGA